jgi:outer membrane protein
MMHRWTSILVCSMLALACACQSTSPLAPAPRTPRAVLPVPRDGESPRLVGIAEPAVDFTHAPGGQPLRITLEGAIGRALNANRGVIALHDNLASAGLSLAAAQSQFELKIRPAVQVGLFGDGSDTTTQIGAGLTFDQQLPHGTRLGITPRISRRDDEYRAAVDSQLTQPLLRGLSREFNMAAVHSGEFGLRSAHRSLYLTEVNAVLATVRAVYDVIRQRELLRLNEESAERLGTHAEAARAKEAVGLADPIQTYRARIQLRAAQDNLAIAREAFQDALDNLKVLLALPLDAEIVVEAPLTFDFVAMAEDAAIAIALANRVELRQSDDTIREADRNSRIARHGTLPQMDVVLSYSRFGTGGELSDSLGLDQGAWGVSLVSTTDIARTVERIAFEQSVLATRAARRSRDLLHDEIVGQVKRELRTLRRAENRIGIQQENIQNAGSQLELAKLRFERGLASNFDLVEAEAELRRAETTLLEVVLEYIMATYRFRAVLGTLLERPENL